jgi:hypothetical protein
VTHSEIIKKHDKLKGFAQHGVVFDSNSGKQAIGSCRLCGSKHNKFFVNVDNRLWDCKTCGRSGNWEQFLEATHIEDRKLFKADVTRPLAKNRGISAQTFRAFGFGWNGQDYTYPVRDDKKIVDLRRYRPGRRGIATKGSKSGLIGPEKRLDSQRVWICEGEWDALALYEILRKVRVKEDVYAVCGAGNFPKGMLDMFKGREVVLCFDHDEPGQRGLTRTWDLLAGIAASRQRLVWPPELELKDGFDLRDLYHDNDKNAADTYKVLQQMLKTEAPIDSKTADTTSPEVRNAIDPKGKGMKPSTVLREFKKWLVIQNGEVLDVLFGAIFANRIEEADPFWLFFVAPAGGSKSEYLMTLAESPLVWLESALTPHSLISGMDLRGGQDPSLVPKIIGKTLVVKDFTTVLQMPQIQRDEVFSILRDAYDGRCGKAFGNGVSRRYEGHFGIIAGVTPEIDSGLYQSTILGERFVKYRIPIRGKLTKNKKACRRVMDNLTSKRVMREELLEISRKVLHRPVTPELYPHISDSIKDRLCDLAHWVSNMRGFVARDRYTRTVEAKPTSEVGTRLSGQFGIMAMGIALYQQKQEVDEDVYRLIVKIAKDTAPPIAELMIRQLYVNRYDEAATTAEVREWTTMPERTCLYALQDLEMLSVVRYDGRSGLWKLNGTMVKLMDSLKLYDKERGWHARNG